MEAPSLPPPFSGLGIEDKDRLVIDLAYTTEAMTDVDVVVAVKPVGDGAQVSMETLKLKQLRLFAKQMGVSGSSKMNTFQCKHAIAALVLKFEIINQRSSAERIQATDMDAKRRNTLLRTTNIILSEGYVDTFLSSNDQRSRADHEVGFGGGMQHFWKHVSTTMSANLDDPEDDDPFGTIDSFEDDSDDRIKVHIARATEDPKDFTPQSGAVLQQWVQKLVKAREEVKRLMTVSGTHDSDIYNFVNTALKNLKLLKLIGEFPLYYFCVKAAKVPNMDGKFRPFLNDNLKGDSVTLSGTKRAAEDGAVGKRSPPKLNDMLTVFRAAVDAQNKSIELQEKALQASTAAARASKMEELKSLDQILANIDVNSERYKKYEARMSALESELFVDDENFVSTGAFARAD